MKRSMLTGRSGALLTVVPVVLLFAVGGAAGQIDAYWTNPAGGNWVDGPNWSTNPAYPNNGGSDLYNATIDLAGNPYTVSLTSSVELENFTLNSTAATLQATTSASVLRVNGTANLMAGTLSVSQSTLQGGTWNVAPGTFRPTFSSNLVDLTWNGPLEVAANNVWMYMSESCTLNGDVWLSGQSTRLVCQGTQTLDNLTINLVPPSYNNISRLTAETHLTLGPGCVVRSEWGIIGDASGAQSTIVNYGNLLTPPSQPGLLTIEPHYFENWGSISIIPGSLTIGKESGGWVNRPGGTVSAADGTLTFRGAWSNEGTVSVTNSHVFLDGNYTTAGLGTWTGSGNTIHLDGVLDNTGDTFTVTPALGEWRLDGGTIRGGTLRSSGGARLCYSTSSVNYLDGVAIDGPLYMDGGGVRISTDTTFQGDVTFGGSSWIAFDTVRTLDNQDLTLGTASWQATIGAYGHGTLTFGPNLHIHGRGIIKDFTAAPIGTTILNQGIITADVPGTMQISPDVFINEGVINATSGTTVTMSNAWSNANGTINLSNARMDLGGSATTADLGTINRDASSIVNLRGTLNNAGATLTCDAAHALNLWGATLTGGTLNLPDGQGLSLGVQDSYINYNYLSNVAVQGDLRLTSGPYNLTGELFITDGTTISGDIEIDDLIGVYADGGTVFDNKTITLRGLSHLGTWHSDPGYLTFGPNATVTGELGELYGNIINYGQIRVGGGTRSQIYFRPAYGENHGLMTAVAGGSLLVDPFLDSGDDTVLNYGEIRADNGFVGITYDYFTNYGALVATNGGDVVIQTDNLTNLSGSTLTGGTWAVFGDYSTLDIVGATITTNAADVTLSGQWSGFAAFDSLATNQGVLTLLDDRDFTTAGDLLNAGTLHLGPGCLLTVSGVYDADPAATLACELAGLGFDHHGRLLATGSALLDGDLRIVLSAGYTPRLGDTYEVLRAGSLLGTFSGYDLPPLPGGLLFDVAYGTRAVTLTVIPEPATLGLLATALLLLRRRR